MDFIFVHFVELDDILVIHLLKDIHFTLEALDFLRVVNRLLLDELDCSLEASDLVLALAYLSVGALSQLLQYFVVLGKAAVLLLHKVDLVDLVHMGTTVD